jgi:hypothetical protein
MQATCIATFLSCNGSPIYRNVTNTAVWTTSNGSVATFDPSKIGLLKAHAAGTVNMIVTYNGNTYSWDPATNGCDATPDPSGYTCPVNVTNSGCPDHLEVMDDNFHSYTCTYSGQTIYRQISYDVVDGNNQFVSGVSIRESLYGESANSCNNGYPTPTGCTTTSGSFTDTLSVNCNQVGGSCGFTTNQQWLWCPPGYQMVVLGTLLSDGLHNNSISVLSHTVPPETNRIPTGTEVYP